MRYLISEAEFFIPTIEKYQDHVVVIRRDQLEGEKLYIGPRDLVFASAQFGTEEEKKIIPHFADFVLFSAETDGLDINFDSKNREVLGFMDVEHEVNATVTVVEGKYLILVPYETEKFDILRDFIKSLDEEVYVLAAGTETIDEEDEIPEVSEAEQNSIVEESNKEE